MKHPIGPLSISSLPAIKFDGEYRVLGCIPSDNNHDFADFGSQLFGQAQHDLREIDLSQTYTIKINDQGSTSSCVGQGCDAGMELVWQQTGNPFRDFDAYFTYGLINGGRDAGAMISSGLMALKKYGAAPKGILSPGQMYQQQFTQQVYNEAARFKLAMAFKCNTFDEICQAINLGFCCPLGIMVGDNFSNVDSEGISPLRTRGGGGHCILGVGLKRHPRYGWLIKTQNSWGTRFGINGFSYLRREHFSQMAPDAFAIQTVFDDPKDTNTEDDVPVVTG